MRARAVSIDPTRHGAILAASPAQSRAGPGRCCLRGVRGVGGVGWSHVGGVGWSHGAGSRMRPRQALEEASAATAAVEASVPAPDDPVISVMFTLAVVALSVLTIGVAYLSISSFLDQRQEEEDRKKAGYGPSKADGGAQRQGAGRSTTFDESAFEPARGASKKKRKAAKAPKKKSEKSEKGFGN